jgi:protein phosphatase methylesterase 1
MKFGTIEILKYIYDRSQQQSLPSGPLPLFIMHHGAGHTKESFHLLSLEIQKLHPCDILTFDCRSHGQTTTQDENDLSLDTLVKDLQSIVDDCQEYKQIILVGHSMGAAVVVGLMQTHIRNVIGTIVIDVVEGSALEVLYSNN